MNATVSPLLRTGGCVSGYTGLFAQTNNIYGLGILNSPRGVRYMEDQVINGLVDREAYTWIGDFLYGEAESYIDYVSSLRNKIKGYYDEAAKLGFTIRGESNACMNNIPTGYPTFKADWRKSSWWVKDSYNPTLEALITSVKAGNDQEAMIEQIIHHLCLPGYEPSLKNLLLLKGGTGGATRGEQARALANLLTVRKSPVGYTWLTRMYYHPLVGQVQDQAKAVSLALEADRLGLATYPAYSLVLKTAYRYVS